MSRGAAALALVLAAGAGAQTPDTAMVDDTRALFEAANERYRSGDFAGAASLYRRVLRVVPQSVPARYNLANAAARAGRPAEALRQLLGVLRRHPRDAAARHNAAVVAARLREAAGPRSQAAIAGLPTPPLSWLSLREIAWVLLVALYVVAACAAIAILRPRGRRMASIAGVLIFLAAAGLGLAGARAAARAPDAVVMRSDAGALAGPSPDQPQVLTLPAGAAVRLGERRAGWLFVSLPNGLSGWMLETDVAAVP